MFRWRYLLRVGLAVTLVCILGAATSAFAAEPGDHPKLDRKLNDRASKVGTSRVIVMLKSGWSADAETKKLGGTLGRRLGLINGQVAELPNGKLRNLADYAGVARIVEDRPVAGEMNRVAVTVGARAVEQAYGYTGAGVGVAVIDSGINGWHDDLTYAGSSNVVQTLHSQRVPVFVNFTATPKATDDYGHGTHVAGIIAGNGFDSLGIRAGIAKDAHLVSLKVLDDNGNGVISNVIAALDYAVANKARYNIRVINLSVGARVNESYTTDPLTLAAKRAVDAGIVLVAAAGNFGKNSRGEAQYGAITAPGNAPWVVTVGASSHEGTVSRTDDTMAPYSSRGPTAINFLSKPDLVAPGTGVVSLSDSGSLFFRTKSAYLLSGVFGYKPYLSLTGTSMSAPVVTGTVALMVQANPKLTPNLVKAILQYTAQVYPGYNALTQGAGFLNTKGAVDLARFFNVATPGQAFPTDAHWSKKIIWGNHRVGHGVIKPNAPAWKLGVVWGAAKDLSDLNVAWGILCDEECDNIVWGTSDSEDNVVWGTAVECNPDVEICDNIVWGTYSSVLGDGIVWGTAADDEDNIVWGTDCEGADCDNVVWGTAVECDPDIETCDNIVWGTADDCNPDVETCDNIVWGTSDAEDNVVWGTAVACDPAIETCDNVVWGTNAECPPGEECDNIVWGTADLDIPLFDNPDADPVAFDATVWEDLFGPVVLDPLVVLTPEPTVTAPTATVTEPVTTLTEPVTTLTEPVTTLTEPVTTLTEPVTTLTEPVTTLTEPVTTLTEPATAVIEPTTTIMSTPLTGVIGGI